jgi:hypothetical protein
MGYMQDNIDWIGVSATTPGAPITMLDYACGNGIASKVKSIKRGQTQIQREKKRN